MYRKAIRTKVGCNRKVRQPEESWIIIPDHHEGIVSQELFKRANDSIRKGKTADYDRSAVRRGIVFCGCCGNRLELRKTKHPYYLCKRRNLLNDVKCNDLYVEKGLIEQSIWSIWQEHCRLFETISFSQFFEKRQGELKRREDTLKQQLVRLPAEKINLYERFRSGAVRQDVFLKEKALLNQQEEVARTELEGVLEEMDAQEKKRKSYRSIVDLMERHKQDETFTEEFMREMVDKVIVYEDRRIEIVWKYGAEFEKIR